MTVWVVVDVGSRGVLTTLRSFFDIRVLGIHLSGPLVPVPSEWSVNLGFHLNGPLSCWNEQALMFSGVSWRHPPLGPSASGSPGSLPRLSARRTRSSNTPRTTHVTGGRRLTAYTWPQGVPTSGSREKETGEFSGVSFGFRTLSSGVAAVR